METHFKRSVSQGITLVGFNAAWCLPCRRQATIIESLAQDFRGAARIRTLDIDENQSIAMDLGIQSIPTIIIYKNGKEIRRFVGLQPAETLDNALRAAMDIAES